MSLKVFPTLTQRSNLEIAKLFCIIVINCSVSWLNNKFGKIHCASIKEVN